MFESDEAAIGAARKETEEAKTEAARLKSEKESVEARLAEKEKELEKERNKQINFKALKDMSEQEKEEFTATELALKKEVEDARAEADSARKAQLSDWRQAAIERASRGDAEKAKAIEAALSDVAGEDKDRTSIESRVTKAAKLARKDDAHDPISAAFSFGGSAPEQEKKDYSETDEGLAQARSLGFRFASKK